MNILLIYNTEDYLLNKIKQINYYYWIVNF